MSDKKLTGHCMCGAVSCIARGDPVSTVNCHCSDCRRATGSAFGTVLYFHQEQVRTSGTVSRFKHKSDRGTDVTRMFCPVCGSPMFTRAAAWPDLIGIRAGCIDQTERILPQRNVFVSGRIKSTALDPDLPQTPRMP